MYIYIYIAFFRVYSNLDIFAQESFRIAGHANVDFWLNPDCDPHPFGFSWQVYQLQLET